MRRPSYLLILPTSSQMYSGTGKACFDWIRFAKRLFTFTVICDLDINENFAIIKAFCDAEDIELIVSDSYKLPGCPDTGIADLPLYASGNRFDFIETVSWANAATNIMLLESVNSSQKIVYTPHTQPMWTLGEPTRFPCVLPTYVEMIHRSDLVLIDSPSEFGALDLDSHGRHNAVYIPLGVDHAVFCNDGVHVQNSLLCIGDYREHRKRFDIILNSFYLAFDLNNNLKMTIIGKNSEQILVPDKYAEHIVLLGYVSFEEILLAYKSASVFVLLSDYEAFGLPIAEALCCGTQVLINEQKSTSELFSDLPGVHIVNNREIIKVRDKILEVCQTEPNRDLISMQAHDKFRFSKTYGEKWRAIRKLDERT